MNELTNQIQQIMLPKAALIAYECKTNNYSRSQNYLELRPINEKGRMGAGIPVTYDFMNSLMESYSESMNGIPHGRVPKKHALVRPKKRERKVHLVQPAAGEGDVFQEGSEHLRRDFQYAGNHLCGGARAPECPCLQRKSTRRQYETLPGTLFQRDRLQCLSGIFFTGKATGDGFLWTSGVLGKAFLAQ